MIVFLFVRSKSCTRKDSGKCFRLTRWYLQRLVNIHTKRSLYTHVSAYGVPTFKTPRIINVISLSIYHQLEMLISVSKRKKSLWPMFGNNNISRHLCDIACEHVLQARVNSKSCVGRARNRFLESERPTCHSSYRRTSISGIRVFAMSNRQLNDGT
jgi:hypothetical protein